MKLGKFNKKQLEKYYKDKINLYIKIIQNSYREMK